jgi:hypothetical protein
VEQVKKTSKLERSSQLNERRSVEELAIKSRKPERCSLEVRSGEH